MAKLLHFFVGFLFASNVVSTPTTLISEGKIDSEAAYIEVSQETPIQKIDDIVKLPKRTENSILWEKDVGELHDLMMCESGGDPQAVNPKDIDGKKKYGLFQYDEETWSELSRLSGLSGDILDPYAQIILTRWALKNGHEWRWGVCL